MRRREKDLAHRPAPIAPERSYHLMRQPNGRNVLSFQAIILPAVLCRWEGEAGPCPACHVSAWRRFMAAVSRSLAALRLAQREPAAYGGFLAARAARTKQR
ncbi:MAG: hypothetical protein BMS9Abin28_1475 [Anaerolineae bacterium]|nr:MAG: hypothetical protein BMS9Abin28_1475 [Anaerolineae bacterium]